VRKSFLVFCVVALALSACSSVSQDESSTIDKLPELTCVAVLPVMIPQATGATRPVAVRQTLDAGAQFLDTVFEAELGPRPEFKVLSQERQNAILADPWGGRQQQVAKIGAATGCGAVLQTSVSRFRERIGSTMSAERPASAAFSMELIDVSEGVVLWTSSFDERQKALFEDIFSFDKAQKRGFKWLTVEELSRDGLMLRLQTFPYFQPEEEE
jgi:hypothetical protein